MSKRLNKQRGMAILIAALAISAHSYGITPPAVTPAVCSSVSVTWAMPTTRTDGSALSASEIAKTTLWFTGEAAAIDVPAPATRYTYTIPAGVTTTAADGVAATVTDAGGLRSAPSALATTPAGLTCAKALPSAPTMPAIIGIK